MENNKIIGSILLAGLIAMLSGTFAKILYAPQSSHAEGEEKRGYQVEVSSDDSGSADSNEEINILAMIAAGNVEAGEKISKKCLACHSFDKGGPNKVGPVLWGVVGAKKAAHSDFQYSKAMQDKGGNWDYESLWAFVNNPAAYVTGTKMAFAGVKKPEQLADLIAYMRSKSDSPIPLPKAAE